MNKSFSIGEAISYGWNRVWANWQVLCGGTLALYIINIVIELITKGVKDSLPGVIAMGIVGAAFGLFTAAVASKAALLEGRGVKATWKAVSDATSTTYGRLLLMFVLTALIILAIGLIGFVLILATGNNSPFQALVMTICFVTFVFISVRLRFTAFSVIDGSTAVESIKKSWKITKGVFWKLLGLSILLALINIVGAIALLVGLLVTIPLSIVAMGHVYNKLHTHHSAA